MNEPNLSSAESVPSVGTTLAFERTRIAYERTMMAWIRTATSLITFGFAVYKFFEFELKNSPAKEMVLGPREFGLALIILGLVSMLFGTMEHARDLSSLRARYPAMPKSFSSIIAMLVCGLGILALLAVVLRA
jgi:putative membrane protein